MSCDSGGCGLCTEVWSLLKSCDSSGCSCCTELWVWLIASFSACRATITSCDTPATLAVAVDFLLTAESDRVVLVTNQ